MKKIERAMAAAVLLMSVGARADWKIDVGAVTQYYFRGLEQTSGLAGQGGVSWSGDLMDVHPYAGLWASNLDKVHGLGRVETDAFGGFVMRWHDLNVDLGARYYYFPDADSPSGTDDIEPYVGLSLVPISMKASYSPDYYSTGYDSWYVQSGVTVPVRADLLLHLHAAMTFGQAQVQYGEGSYDDYAISAIYRLPWWDVNVSATYLLTEAPGEKSRFIAGISKSFEL